MILLALLEDADGVTTLNPGDDEPMVYVSSDLIGWVRGTSDDDHKCIGSVLEDRDGKTLGYIRRTPRELARLINGLDKLPEAEP